MKKKTDYLKDLNYSFPMFICFLFFPLVFTGCEQQDDKHETAKVEKMNYEGTIIAVGDSLTAGYGVMENEAYPALLEKKLLGDGYNWQVINAGISGETSSGMVSRIPWIITRHPDIVILETGANDGLRGIPISVIHTNIKKAVVQLQDAEIEVVLAGMQVVQNLGEEYNREFSSLYTAIAKEKKIISIPFFLEGVAGNPALNLSDTIHPNAEGYKIITDEVYPYVLEAIAAWKK